MPRLDQHAAVAAVIRGVFNCPDRPSAERRPKEIVTAHTATALERVNMELKCRTRIAGLFPNEASLLRLVSTLLAETSDEWETGKAYLNLQSQT